jgi:tetratricopeptide (TPR) repeat protein
MNHLHNVYLFKALEAYPYDLEEAIEAMQYALSYDDNNSKTLCLIGRLYAEQLDDFETAKGYFEKAMTANIKDVGIYPHYLNVLIWNEDYQEALKLVDYALTLKSIDKALMYVKKSSVLEHQFQYKEALDLLKTAKKHTYNDGFMGTINGHKNRIKAKMPKNKKKKKKKKDKKKSDKKKVNTK